MLPNSGSGMRSSGPCRRCGSTPRRRRSSPERSRRPGSAKVRHLTEQVGLTIVSVIAKLNSKGAAAMSDDPFSISDRLESTAEWRRGKAEEFPDDKRNLEAAEQLERLAAEVRALDDTEIDK